MKPDTGFIDHPKTKKKSGMFKRKLLNIGHGRLNSLKNNAMNIIE